MTDYTDVYRLDVQIDGGEQIEALAKSARDAFIVFENSGDTFKAWDSNVKSIQASLSTMNSTMQESTGATKSVVESIKSASESFQVFEAVSQRTAQSVSGSFAAWDASAKSAQQTISQTFGQITQSAQQLASTAEQSFGVFESVTQHAAQSVTGSFAAWNASVKSIQQELRQLADETQKAATKNQSTFLAFDADAKKLQASLTQTTQSAKNFGSGATDTQQKIAGLTAQIAELETALKATNSVADKGLLQGFIRGLREELKGLQEQAGVTAQAVNNVATGGGGAAGPVPKTLESDAKKATAAHKELIESGKNLSASFQTAGASAHAFLLPVQAIGGSLGQLGGAIQGVAGEITNLGYTSMAAASAGLAPMVVAGAAVIAMTTGLGVAVARLANEWDTAMTSISIATGTAKDQLQGLGTVIQNTASNTGTAAVKLAEGYAQVIGGLQLYNQNVALTTTQNQALISTAARLANVTGTEEKAAFESLTSVVMAFNVPFEKIPELGDKIFNAWRVTGIPLQQLADTLDRVAARGGPVAKNLDDVAKVLVAASEAGLHGGKALESVNSAIEKLAGTTPEVDDRVGRLGIDMDKWADPSLINRMTLLGERWHKLGDEQAITNEAAGIFGTERGPAVANIALKIYDNTQLLNDVVGKTGTLVEASGKKAETATQQWNNMWESLKTGAATAGVAVGGFFNGFGTGVDNSIKKMEEWGNNFHYWMVDRQNVAGQQRLGQNLDPFGPNGYASMIAGMGTATLPHRELPPGARPASAQEQEASARDSINSTFDQLAAKYNTDDLKAQFGAAGTTAKDFYDLVNDLNKETTKSEEGYSTSLGKTLQAIENLSEEARQRGVPAAKEYTDALRGVIRAGITSTSENGVLTYGFDPAKLEEAERLLRILGNEIPEKKPSEGPPAETVGQRLNSMLGSNLAGAREEAGPAAGAITQFQQSLAERDTTLARTGKDTAVGAAASAVSAIQKIYQDAAKAGVEGASQLYEELKPLIVRAFGGDDSARSEVDARLTALGQEIERVQLAAKWDKAWTEAMDRIAAHNREVQDQMLLDQAKWDKQATDEEEKHQQNEREIASRNAIRLLEIDTKLHDDQVAGDLKATNERADADEALYRKREDLATKFADDDAKLKIQWAAKDAEILTNHADKVADIETSIQRKREDLKTDTDRKIADLPKAAQAGGLFGSMSGGNFGNTGGVVEDPKEKILADAKRAEDDLRRDQRRSLEDADTQMARARRDQQARLAEEASTRKLNRDAELRDAETTHNRKMDDIEKESQRRNTELETRAKNEKDLDAAKTAAQLGYFTTEEQKEEARHKKAKADLEEEQRIRAMSQEQSNNRFAENLLPAFKALHPDLNEDELRQQFNDLLGQGNGGGQAQSNAPEAPSFFQKVGDFFKNNVAPGIHDLNVPGFASGGAFTVGGFGGIDSTMVKFYATPGERVTVGGGSSGSGGGGSDVMAAISDLKDRPIVVYLDGKQLETSLTRRQIGTIESRVATGGRF